MKTRQIFHPLFLLALLVVAGGFSQRALAQYQSFFGDSITECSIGGNFVTYDPYFFGVESYELSWTCSDTITINDNHYFQIDNPYPIWEWMDNNIYLREDANMGRVYRYDPYCDCELLICDMSMEEGDTFLFLIVCNTMESMKIRLLVLWIVCGTIMEGKSFGYSLT